MAEKLTAGRSAGDRCRSFHGAVRLANRYASVPVFGAGLSEVRSSLPGGRIARLLFFADEGRLGVVHGLIKKTQKTQAEDLALARKRMKEMKA